jgi:hypothetical protein
LLTSVGRGGTAKTFFAVLSIAAFTIMVGISNNGMALSSSSSLFTDSKDIHKVHLSINIIDPSRDSTITSHVILVTETSVVTEQVTITVVYNIIHTSQARSKDD